MFALHAASVLVICSDDTEFHCWIMSEWISTVPAPPVIALVFPLNLLFCGRGEVG
jgi:hypothetical protein